MPRYYYLTPEDIKTAKDNGISEANAKNRVYNLGWSVERAIKEPLRKRDKTDKWYKLAVSNGILPNTYLARIKLGWDKELAATKPVMNRNDISNKASNSRRRYSKELIEIAYKNGIAYPTFTTRINRDGMTPLEAATMPKKGPGGRELVNEI